MKFGEENGKSSDRTNERAGQYAGACRAAAKQMGAGVIDLWTSIQKHPNWQTECLRWVISVTISPNSRTKKKFDFVRSSIKRGDLASCISWKWILLHCVVMVCTWHLKGVRWCLKSCCKFWRMHLGNHHCITLLCLMIFHCPIFMTMFLQLRCLLAQWQAKVKWSLPSQGCYSFSEDFFLLAMTLLSASQYPERESLSCFRECYRNSGSRFSLIWDFQWLTMFFSAPTVGSW